MKSIFIKCNSTSNDYYKYTHSFIWIKVYEYLYDNNASLEDIINMLLNYFAVDELDLDSLNTLLKNNLEYYSNNFYLKPIQKSIMNRLKKVKYLFFKYSNTDYDKLISLSNDYIYELKHSLEETISYIFALENFNENKPDELYFIRAFNLLKSEDNAKYYLDLFINHSQFNNIDINKKFKFSNVIQNIFKNGKIKYFSDLKNYTLNFILVAFGDSYDNLLDTYYDMSVEKYVEQLNRDLYFVIDKVLDDTNQVQLNKDIFYRRLANFDKKDTLDSLGKEYHVTRERIRQIEQHLVLKISKNFKLYGKYIDITLYSILLKNNGYFSYESFKKLFGDNVINKIVYLITQFNEYFYISYDDTYKIIYDISSFVPALEIKKFIDKQGNTIKLSTFELFDDFKKNITLSNYRLRFNDEVYVIKGLNQNEIIFNELDQLFPNGFRIGSEEDYNILKIAIKDKFSTSYDIADKHALQGLLMRYNYCFIDKGKVINRKYVPELNEVLISKILNFINEAENIIYYNTIYEHFKNELNEYGVNNRYYLKGIIDNYLPSEYSHQRDYISVGKNLITPFDVISNDIISFEGIIKLDELRQKYPGVKDYTLMNYIDQIEDSIWLKYNDSFILGRNINISKDIVDIINSNIISLLNIMKSQTISVSKLYSRIKLLKPKIFDELSIFDNQFAFYSLLVYLFKDKYYFGRPYLSIDKNANLTSSSILLAYLSKLDRVNLNIINNYISKMHLSPLYSYLDFLDSNSNLFVQINKEDAVKKELIRVNDSVLNEIKYQLNYYLDSYGNLDTRNYIDFYSLPSINYSWNKYLLVGIIRTFMKDDFEVEYTDSMYNHTDYIIRRVN